MNQEAAGNGKHILTLILWPALILLGFIMVSSVGLVIAAFFSPPGELGKVLGEAHAISRLVTLVLIVPALVVLAVLDKVEGPVVATALSAIAAYVLGSASAP